MTPYWTGASLCLDAGWAGVLPLPRQKKSPPPSGYTGWNGKDPSAKMIETWCNETVGDYQAASNIAIHTPDGVIDVDVDHYNGKTGGDTLAQLEAELGELPPTYKSTSRDDGVSGILWYRVKPGLRWPTGPGKDIEFIHKGHRYAVVWPSIHPDTGNRYIWIDQHDGDEAPPPDEDQLAWMPDEWQLRFTGGEARTEQPEYRAATEEERVQCLTQGEPCKATRNALAKYQDRVVAAARHDSMIQTVMALVRHGEQGHQGVMTALKTMHGQFTADVAVDRRDGSEQSEFQRAVNGAIAKVSATPTPEAKKGCCGDADDFTGIWEPNVNTETGEVREAPPHVDPITLEEARATFKRWLGDDYDTDALDAMLAAAAVERLDGDPLWLLIISGSGNAKTETVQALSGINAVVASTITSEGALLSATSKRERSKDATGGLLREIGDRGVLVIKDVTSILSMGRELRGQVLGALREIHDGSWVRKAGTDGGRSLPWSGRIVVVGAVTTKWDQAHDVIASMGDRFVLIRVDSTSGRVAAGRKAIGNTGVEAQMRADLAGAVAGVIAGMETTATVLTDEETDIVLAAADLVTLARTGVEYDYRGDVIDAHAPEMPTRFAKELTQIIRGAVAIGIPRREALGLAIRCARDSMPPLRLKAIDDLAANPASTTCDVRRRINKPWSTVDRQLQALHMLGVLDVDEATYGNEKTRWYYSLANGIDPKALDPKSSPEKSVGAPSPQEERGSDSNKHSPVTDISGEDGRGGDMPECWQCGRELVWPDEQQRKTCSRCRPAADLFGEETTA